MKSNNLFTDFILMLAITVCLGIVGRLVIAHFEQPADVSTNTKDVAVETEEAEFFKESLKSRFNLEEYEDVLILPDQNIEPIQLAAVYTRETANELVFAIDNEDFAKEIEDVVANISSTGGKKKVKAVEGDYDNFHTITLVANRVMVDSIPVEVLRGYVDSDKTLEELNPEIDFSEAIVSGEFYIW